ncbi:hypothetical protein S7711_09014 [Stachybotrys chartarum IBT 7711]|uniref:Zn(2)-C6 fungal-type domain-containing protein n=1 Tax=Stachybotrys chartarum (strain CBS 109288 / IBT 7711) TaxID=1280523 RepID=A0A084AX85_STACB|nr:hypothetical protein S7711_09014 [Stachybotrys chartarum IBT 7711]
MNRQYRPLRPARRFPSEDDEPQPPTVTWKREKVKLACNNCRLKKSAVRVTPHVKPANLFRKAELRFECDGQRPVCGACVKRGSACVFLDSTRHLLNASLASAASPDSSGAELLSILQTGPESHVREVLGQLRAGEDIPKILNSWKERNRLAALSVLDESNIPLFSPPDQESLEFELMIRHPVSYPTPTSLEGCLYSPSTSQGAKLLLTLRPYNEKYVTCGPGSLLLGILTYMFSVIHRDAQIPLASQSQTFDSDNPLSTRNSTGTANTPTSIQQPPAESYWALRLREAHFSDWTDVPITNDEAIRVASLYLEIDHPLLGLFDADLFVQDLVSGRSRFCSRFLVEAFLSWAHLEHGSDQPTTTELLLAAAATRWEDGQVLDSLPSVQALQLLSLTTCFLGQGSVSKEFLHQSIMMGSRMNLLPSRSGSAEQAPPFEEDRRAVSQAAWGLFSFATYNSFHCQQLELGPLHPPNLPHPAQPSQPKPSEAPEPSTPDHLGATFPSLSRLWVIVHDVLGQGLKESKRPLSERYDLNYINSALARLLAWAEDLPAALARGNRITHHGLILHIYFHAAVLFILRPLIILRKGENSLALPAVSTCAAPLVAKASVNQLKRLTIIYQSHFQEKAPTVLWHTACLYVANAACRDSADDPTRWHFFDIAIQGYTLLAPRFPIVIAIIKALMMIALSTDLITNQEAFRLVDLLQGKDRMHFRYIAEPTKTCVLVDLDMAISDANAAQVDKLAQRFDELALLDELTEVA